MPTSLINVSIEYPQGALAPGDPRNTLRQTLTNVLRGRMNRLADRARNVTRYPRVAQDFYVEQETGSDLGTYAFGNRNRAYVYLGQGSKPHPIVARNAPYLVFEGNRGHLVRIRRVQHPGVGADTPVIQVVTDAEDGIVNAAADAVQRWALRFGSEAVGEGV